MSGQPEYLTIDEIMEVHQSVIRRFGETATVRDVAALESCAAQPRMEVFGEELYPTLADKAAAYWFFISENQPFSNGNKRAGFVCAIRFLQLNTRIIEIDENLAFRTLIAVIRKEVDRSELVRLFQGMIVDVPT